VCASRIDKQVFHRSAAEYQLSNKRWWVSACLLIPLFLTPLLLALLATYTVNQQNQPGDEELASNFLSHQAAFEELVEMLLLDCRDLRLERGEVNDLKMLSTALDNARRVDKYKDLLKQISIAELRYFPSSGRLILLPDGAHRTGKGSSKSYVYLPDGLPEPLVKHHGYYLRGPGVSFLTGDRRIKGDWYIHYDTMITLAFSPY
jgi:hypothetical protein